MRLRQEHPIFHRRSFFSGARTGSTEEGALPEIEWLDAGGVPMDGSDWAFGHAHALCAFLNGDAIPEVDRRGTPIVDDSFLVLLNAHSEDLDLTLPAARYGERWTLVLDTSTPPLDVCAAVPGYEAGSTARLTSRSVVVLTRPSRRRTSR